MNTTNQRVIKHACGIIACWLIVMKTFYHYENFIFTLGPGNAIKPPVPRFRLSTSANNQPDGTETYVGKIEASLSVLYFDEF